MIDELLLYQAEQNHDIKLVLINGDSFKRYSNIMAYSVHPPPPSITYNFFLKASLDDYRYIHISFY